MRDILLERKVCEITKELRVWAMQNSILELGESIVFSLRIESVPFVIRDKRDTHSVAPRELTIPASLRHRDLMPVEPRDVGGGVAEEILSKISYAPHRTFLHKLLIENKNKPLLVAIDGDGGEKMGSYYECINRALRMDVRGVYYRLLRNSARGNVRQHFYQLYLIGRRENLSL